MYYHKQTIRDYSMSELQELKEKSPLEYDKIIFEALTITNEKNLINFLQSNDIESRELKDKARASELLQKNYNL
jgi:hypothetical protein